MGSHPQPDGISVMENQYLNAASVSFQNVRKCCWLYHETALKIRKEKNAEIGKNSVCFCKR